MVYLSNRHHNIIDICLNSRFQIPTIRDINQWPSATSRHRTQTDTRSAETSCSVSGVWAAFVRREAMYIMSGHAARLQSPQHYHHENTDPLPESPPGVP